VMTIQLPGASSGMPPAAAWGTEAEGYRKDFAPPMIYSAVPARCITGSFLSAARQALMV
jgi:hypothetical protein